jgi:predicted nucleic acid-binding protein
VIQKCCIASPKMTNSAFWSRHDFTSIPAGATVFLDANTLIYHFTSDPQYGAACTQLIKQVELQQIRGVTSAHVLADVAHRLMTLEAMSLMNWPAAGIAPRLRKHHVEIPKLTVYRQAIARIPLLGIQVLPITFHALETATHLSHQCELLTGDALIVAVMQANGFTIIASNDADFDRVPGFTRYAPA